MEKIILCTTFKFVKNFVKMKDDPYIIMKGANSESAVMVWDREDYSKKPYHHLQDKEVYEEVGKNSSFFCQYHNERITNQTQVTQL